ncbi:hypothetical protein FB45DRAFT_863372 [Roridomyces roridus]|uniref:Uncharacterized protein n=1 Tax=Roridomyces roridus TaxID=1738132 RepID=A0AAD7C3F6_9AGAR|nr:hypothetical protein FB45DRAFT_863372 [Roridomyces roridus]
MYIYVDTYTWMPQAEATARATYNIAAVPIPKESSILKDLDSHVEVDPPRIGLLSTVPTDAGTLLQAALTSAEMENDGNLFSTSDPAPTGLPVAGGTVNGVPIAPVGKVEHPTANTSGGVQMLAGWKWPLVLMVSLGALM